ncbi:hypothetical protein GRI94_18520 [Erythrobacter jejuensis]|uniref:Uncharacterized protein n=2 Tax=Parerythrobacter jejuensis TaxID=795812 RepID=A0A845AW92_9SPHN|nr:hypothetical protein [Parerythrobacter jejuensis]MXP33828.1 hypothetical protein [Parerythrobacter jejuensis]
MESAANTNGRGPMFWMGMMLASYGVIIALVMTGAIEGPAVTILMLAPLVLTAPMIWAANRQLNAAQDGCLGRGVAQKRYVKRVAVFSSLYLVSFGIFIFATKAADLGPWLRPFLAVLPGLAIIGIIWAVGRLIAEEDDEFLRMLVIRQSLVATGIALSAASIWGFLETADIVFHLDAYWWVVVWFFGLGIGAAANRIEYGTWGAV